MSRSCNCVVVAVILPLIATNSLSGDINWVDTADSESKSKQSLLPIVFFISAAAKDEAANTVPTSFEDARVSGIINNRFIPVLLPSAMSTKILLKQLEAPKASPPSILVATPRGKKVGVITAEDLAKAAKLAEELNRLFNDYRNKRFENILKALLEDKSTKPADVAESLTIIERLQIGRADKAVAAQLKRKNIDETLRIQVYVTLAALPTKVSAETLLSEAMRNTAAVAALAKATPQAAEHLLAELDLENKNRSIIAYEAIVKICEIKNRKPTEFWDSDDSAAQKAEFDRLGPEVAAKAAKWRKQNGLERGRAKDK